MLDCLLPQAPSVTAAVAAARRVRDFVVRRIRRRILSSRDRGPAAAAPVLLQDRTQAAHGPRVPAPQPAAGAERLADPVGEHLRFALERERHAGGVGAVLLELVGAQGADAVELAGAAGLDDQPRALDLGEDDVGPREAVAALLHAEARARPAPVGVLAG